MKILILSSEFPPGPGGIGTHAFQLAKNFSLASHDVQVLTPQDYATEDEIFSFNGSQPFAVLRFINGKSAFSKALTRISKLNSTLRHFEPDVILVSGSRSIWMTAFLTTFYRNIPWVVVAHGTEFGQLHGLNAWLTKLSANQASAMICVSQYTRQAVRALGVNKPPMEVVHNGADDAQYYKLEQDKIIGLRSALDVEGKFVLLTVGNVSARKGQEVVIRALPAILQRAPQVVYWMAGLPTEQKSLQKLAIDLGVEKSIRFLDRVSNQRLLELYNACDLFVMTSRQLENGDFEGYGIAVVEAALCGKAAVVSNNSGLAEAVLDGQTGLLVNQNDPEATARAIIHLIENTHELAGLSKNAFSKASKQTWSEVSATYLEVFAKIKNQVEGKK